MTENVFFENFVKVNYAPYMEPHKNWQEYFSSLVDEVLPPREKTLCFNCLLAQQAPTLPVVMVTAAILVIGHGVAEGVRGEQWLICMRIGPPLENRKVKLAVILDPCFFFG